MLRISSLLFGIIISCSLFSQTADSISKYKPSFGFNFGLNQSILYNSNATEELQIQNAPGFRLGITSDFPISMRWSISPKAELSFNYGRLTEDNINYRVDPNNFDFMTHFKYSMKGYDGKVKPYFYIGPNFRVPLKKELDGIHYDTRSSLAFDFAFGLDIELKHFLISPELRFTGGLTDIRSNPSGKMLRGSNAALIINFSSK